MNNFFYLIYCFIEKSIIFDIEQSIFPCNRTMSICSKPNKTKGFDIVYSK